MNFHVNNPLVASDVKLGEIFNKMLRVNKDANSGRVSFRGATRKR